MNIKDLCHGDIVEVKGIIDEESWVDEMYNSIGKVGMIKGFLVERQARKEKRVAVKVYVGTLNNTFNYHPDELYLVRRGKNSIN